MRGCESVMSWPTGGKKNAKSAKSKLLLKSVKLHWRSLNDIFAHHIIRSTTPLDLLASRRLYSFLWFQHLFALFYLIFICYFATESNGVLPPYSPPNFSFPTRALISTFRPPTEPNHQQLLIKKPDLVAPRSNYHTQS